MSGVHQPVFVLAAAASLLTATNAAAHILVTDPPARVAHHNTKLSPCGEAVAWGEGGVTTFAPGEQITLQWDETILHPGYFRVAVSTTGDAALTMPSEADFDTFKAFYNSGSGSLPDPIEHPTGMEVDGLLLYYDYYAPHGMRECGGTNSGGSCSYEVTLTLPNSCEECTIQLVQSMVEINRTYGADGHYYHCVDFTIEGGAGETTGDSSTDTSGGDTSTTLSTTTGSTSGAGPGATGDTTTTGSAAGTGNTAPMPTTGSTTAAAPPAAPPPPPADPSQELPPDSTAPQPPPTATAPLVTATVPSLPTASAGSSGLPEMANNNDQASGGCSFSRGAPHRESQFAALLSVAALVVARRRRRS